jgi:hypothetical protein
MGMYDEFIDIDNRKSSQSKAFGSNLFYYFTGDIIQLNDLFEKNKLVEPSRTMKIYADTNLPFEFIEIDYLGAKKQGTKTIYEGRFSRFREIKDVEYGLLISPFTLYVDYWGRSKTMTTEEYYNYERMQRLWDFFIENVHLTDREMHSIPYLYYDRYNENHKCDKCSKKRLKYLQDRWNFSHTKQTESELEVEE